MWQPSGNKRLAKELLESLGDSSENEEGSFGRTFYVAIACMFVKNTERLMTI